MDTTPLASGAVVRHVLRFEGRAGEYFRIWIVNLALTILTLGIFSAWAKIRTKRYLYGNTYIGEHAFDYHASPWRILLGRIIALALLLGYSITGAIAPKFVIAWIVIFVIALPWMVKSSLRFNARNTSYRNIRFNFHGTYGGALKAFILWPMLSFITLFTTLPLAHRARDYYNINNHSFGGKDFKAVIPGAKIYLIYLLGLALYGAAIIAVLTILIASIELPVNIWLIRHHLPPLHFHASPAMIVISAVVYIIGVIFAPVIIHTLTFNLAISRTKLGGDYQLEARLSPLRMAWILFSNLIATMFTLGLLYPWSRIRQTRYMAGRIAITGPDDMSSFVSNVSGAPGAVGEEIAGFFDIDFGL